MNLPVEIAMSAFGEPTIFFPDPSWAGPEGLVWVGGELTVANLHLAYSKGIFPWPMEEEPLLWFCPLRRGVLFLDELRLPRSFQKKIKDHGWRFTWDRAFSEVITACQMKVRPGQAGTWITEEMREAYENFHKAGFAHSFECWSEEGDLIGGLYGVFVEGVFSGESMFYKVSDASKFCLWKTLELLKSQGLQWIDTQMVTPVLESFGAREVSRNVYLQMLKEAQVHSPKTLLF